MNAKRQSVPHAKPAAEKVSVVMSRQLRRKVERTAKEDRRKLSPQLVMLIEAGLAAREDSKVA